ncbi:hypothetical protein [Chishuiella sp.]|uniref:hypothetical protein n=1 Tax=Chishuiella sp. TaxID=1969467 RepID=UPI0028B18061|nr:hypothetical protein [Chishuiella sp.]
MIKKFFVTLVTCSIFLISCNSDDDSTNKETKIPIEERNALDDEAIEQLLNDYYFDSTTGKLTKFDTITGNDDDAYPSLKSIAKKDDLGIWYAENPNHVGTGESIVSSDSTSIYLSYKASFFVATNSTDYSRKYGYVQSYVTSSTNTGDGSALKDPEFYYATLTSTEISNGVKRENIELKNFAEGLKHFKTTDRAITDLYNFQGVIILPSRLAFARNKYYTGSSLTENSSYRDASFVINFELPKIQKRTTD